VAPLAVVAVLAVSLQPTGAVLQQISDVPGPPSAVSAQRTSPLAADPSPVDLPLLSASDAAPSPAAGVSPPMARSTPVRLRVPAIGVDSALQGLDLQADGTLQVPADGWPAGWYTGSPTPGEQGPAVLAGHVDWAGSPAVFAALRELQPGAEVAVERANGSVAVFRVTEVVQFAKNAFPTAAVYGNVDHAGLRLITCGGAFDRSARSYVDNLVVFAELVRAHAA
jgi:sortase (surface protein transpeptidase)